MHCKVLCRKSSSTFQKAIKLTVRKYIFYVLNQTLINSNYFGIVSEVLITI